MDIDLYLFETASFSSSKRFLLQNHPFLAQYFRTMFSGHLERGVSGHSLAMLIAILNSNIDKASAV